VGAGRPITGYYFSAVTQLTIGYGEVYATNWLRIVAVAQGLLGVIFITLVFGRILASFAPMKDLSDFSQE
jgi:hypothetical protein